MNIKPADEVNNLNKTIVQTSIGVTMAFNVLCDTRVTAFRIGNGKGAKSINRTKPDSL